MISESGDTVPSASSRATITCFRHGKVAAVSRMLTGQFPNYEAVLPVPTIRTCVDRDEITSAIKRAAIRRTKSQTVKIAVSNGSLEIMASPPPGGGAWGSRSIITKEDLQVGFNYQYLLTL